MTGPEEFRRIRVNHVPKTVFVLFDVRGESTSPTVMIAAFEPGVMLAKTINIIAPTLVGKHAELSRATYMLAVLVGFTSPTLQASMVPKIMPTAVRRGCQTSFYY